MRKQETAVAFASLMLSASIACDVAQLSPIVDEPGAIKPPGAPRSKTPMPASIRNESAKRTHAGVPTPHFESGACANVTTLLAGKGIIIDTAVVAGHTAAATETGVYLENDDGTWTSLDDEIGWRLLVDGDVLYALVSPDYSWDSMVWVRFDADRTRHVVLSAADAVALQASYVPPPPAGSYARGTLGWAAIAGDTFVVTTSSWFDDGLGNWTDNPGFLIGVPKTSDVSEASVLTTTEDTVWAIVSDGAAVYYGATVLTRFDVATSTATTVFDPTQSPDDGSVPADVDPFFLLPQTMTYARGNVFFTVGQGGAVVAVPTTGAPWHLYDVAGDRWDANIAVANDGFVYWPAIDVADPGFPAIGDVMRAPLDGSAAPAVVDLCVTGPNDVFAHDGFLDVIGVAPDVLYRVPLGG